MGVGLKMSDQELIQLLIDNPQEGLREAINEYGTTVHWITTKIIGAKYREDIEECVSDELPQPDREIFIYRYYFKLKISEISKRLGLKPKQVENKLYRGKEIVKKNLIAKGIIL